MKKRSMTEHERMALIAKANAYAENSANPFRIRMIVRDYLWQFSCCQVQGRQIGGQMLLNGLERYLRDLEEADSKVSPVKP